jgi:carbon starvation protein
MPLWVLGAAVLAIFAASYRSYGRLLGRILDVDDATPTPACRNADGKDFAPLPVFPLLAQHFSAISAAGPIVGPIVATLAYGWGPGILWIVLGCVLVGAAHDFATLMASLRHGARSMAEILRRQVGPFGFACFLLFIWLALVLVIVNFTDVTAQAFVRGNLEVGGETLVPGPAVASSSMMYLALAVLMGLLVRRAWAGPRIVGAAGAVLLFLLIPAGELLPLSLPGEPAPQAAIRVWYGIILAYCFAASIVPAPLLLQPRGFLGGILLYAFLLVGLAGLLFGGERMVAAPFPEPASGAPPILPFLFVTIACGACSGFHGLVCSGTTSKQVARESHARAVGYGGMLLEGLVATIALATVAMVPAGALPRAASGAVDNNLVFATGIARFADVFGIPPALGLQFGLLALATFIYDTLDVCTRLGRILVQEIGMAAGGHRIPGSLATAITLALPSSFLFAGIQSAEAWRIFGASNQLLAALSLIVVAIWRASEGRRAAFALVPGLLVAVITVWALLHQALDPARPGLIRGFSGFLLAVAALVLAAAARRGWALRRAGTHEAARARGFLGTAPPPAEE